MLDFIQFISISDFNLKKTNTYKNCSLNFNVWFKIKKIYSFYIKKNLMWKMWLLLKTWFRYTYDTYDLDVKHIIY